MKNSILRFRQLFEGLELDDELIQDLTQDLKDELNLEFEIKKGYFNEGFDNSRWLNDKPTSSEDKLAYLLVLNLKDMGLNKITRNLSNLYNDDRFFELFPL